MFLVWKNGIASIPDQNESGTKSSSKKVYLRTSLEVPDLSQHSSHNILLCSSGL